MRRLTCCSAACLRRQVCSDHTLLHDHNRRIRARAEVHSTPRGTRGTKWQCGMSSSQTPLVQFPSKLPPSTGVLPPAEPGALAPEVRHVTLDYESTAAARDYLEHGLDIHPVPQTGDHKTPVTWWAKRRADARDFSPPTNIGLKTGAEIRRGAFVADADLDMKIDLETKQMFPGANVVVDELLPRCHHIFGRTGAPRSHRI